eukprot:TRINITY_DN3158_c0_g1_i2.p2 TRINITY_DN3158_c0_g1~~TRINITY_DN3158_c0_g1_i2.p2  ORF type:complete len:275 (+),score=68.95 TRINITY_DN3158_c0_g1_i2:190-1014(+)
MSFEEKGQAEKRRQEQEEEEEEEQKYSSSASSLRWARGSQIRFRHRSIAIQEEDEEELDSENDNEENEDEEEEEEDMREGIEQKLIRTEPVLDSFDVEAMEVPGAHKTLNMKHTLRLAFRTLGVVFGDVGTSPLYVFTVAFSKTSIQEESDVLGVLSLVLYTLALIPLIKYAFIVLRASDNGEGGTFALYSLICRYAKVSLLPNQQPADAHISSFKLKLPTPELERALTLKECMENHSELKILLLILVLVGAAMLIVDGILTPAISGFLLCHRL